MSQQSVAHSRAPPSHAKTCNTTEHVEIPQTFLLSEEASELWKRAAEMNSGYRLQKVAAPAPSHVAAESDLGAISMHAGHSNDHSVLKRSPCLLFFPFRLSITPRQCYEFHQSANKQGEVSMLGGNKALLLWFDSGKSQRTHCGLRSEAVVRAVAGPSLPATTAPCSCKIRAKVGYEHVPWKLGPKTDDPTPARTSDL